MSRNAIFNEPTTNRKILIYEENNHLFMGQLHKKSLYLPTASGRNPELAERHLS